MTVISGTEHTMAAIRGVLLDIEGTLTWRSSALPGAAKTISHLRKQSISFRLLTNISARLPVAIAADLNRQGIDIDPAEIQTSATACASFLRKAGLSISDYFLPPSIRPLFHGIPVDNETPQSVVVGDAGHSFSFENMNAAFRSIRNGASLVAMQKNMFWFPPTGVQIDCGAFVAALESATGVSATVTGKPSHLFFQSALAQLGLSSEEVLIVGDDVLTDIVGAHRVGARCALVKTGKGDSSLTAENRPDFILNSIAELPDLLKQLARG